MIISDLYINIHRKLQEEHDRWVLWLPVFYGVGVGIYFLLSFEPTPLPLVLLCLVGAVLVWANRAFLPVLMVCLGITIPMFYTQKIAAPVLPREMHSRQITGILEQIEPKPKGARLLLSHLQIETLPPAVTPLKINVTLHGALPEGLVLGDHIRLKAGLFPPPLPVYPDGFLFNRHFYFKQIGATGFAFGNGGIENVSKTTQGKVMDRIRHTMTIWLIERMGEREGAVAAALITGEQGAIGDEINEAMRNAGISHILSISGLHFALAAGIFYFTIRLLLACIPAIAARYDTKKWAALIALCGAFFYLLLSGSPSPAERSFVMLALVLFAVMLDRSVTSMRSLALAAMLILLFEPAALVGPSFQLSFAATAALLAYYEAWRKNKECADGKSYVYSKWRKIKQFFGGVIMTSALASLATTPFILYHFEHFASYSILGNLATLPVVSFWIMPVVVAIMLLYPFGVADWLLPVLQYGIKLMIWLAEQVSALPYAVISLPPLSLTGLIFVVSGGLWLFLWQARWRHCGWLPIALGLSTLFFYTPPDLVISADGRKIAFRMEDGQAMMLRGRTSGFTQDNWLRYLLVEHFMRYQPQNDVRCDRDGCMMSAHGKKIAITLTREALAEDCRLADILILPNFVGQCAQKTVFDSAWLQDNAGVAFWIRKTGIHTRTVREFLGKRPWNYSHSN